MKDYPKIYFAGKVYGSQDWRCQILSQWQAGDVINFDGGRRGYFDHYKNYHLPVLTPEAAGWTQKHGLWPHIPFADKFVYTGPYYEDVWGGHGVDNSQDHVSHANSNDWEHGIRNMCLQSLHASDIVFAWIDSPSAYGTFIELGVAISEGKPIQVAFSGDAVLMGMHHDMWFLERSPGVLFDYRSKNPVYAFGHLLHSLGQRRLGIRKLKP